MDTGNEKLDRVGQFVRPGFRFVELIIGMLMTSFFFYLFRCYASGYFPNGQ